MTIPAYYLLLFYPIGALSVLLGVALGGWLVFRTRRDSNESLFQLKETKGQAFNIEEDWEKELPEESETPSNVAQAASKFRTQLATHKPDIADKLGGKDNES